MSEEKQSRNLLLIQKLKERLENVFKKGFEEIEIKFESFGVVHNTPVRRVEIKIKARTALQK